MIQAMLKKITFYNFASYDIVQNSRNPEQKRKIIYYLLFIHFTLYTHAFKQKLKENIVTRVPRM